MVPLSYIQISAEALCSANLEVPWSNAAELSIPHLLQQCTIRLSDGSTHSKRVALVQMLHVWLVASRSAQEILSQWLGVAQALAEGRGREEQQRGKREVKMCWLCNSKQLRIDDLQYLQCRVHETCVSQIVQATESPCSWLLV